MRLKDPTRPPTDPANLPGLHDELSACYTMANTLWALAEAAWHSQTQQAVNTLANSYGRDTPYNRLLHLAGRNDDVIRAAHFTAELEELASRLDDLTEALLPVAYPKPAAS